MVSSVLSVRLARSLLSSILSRIQRRILIDKSPSHSDPLGSLGFGHGGPQRNDFGRVWIAMGPALDPSTMRIVVFPGVFLSSSSPISPIFRVKPASAKRRQIETNPRDSLGFFVFLNGFEVVLAEVRKHSGERTLCSCKLRLRRASPTVGLLSGRRAFWASAGFMPSGPRLAATESMDPNWWEASNRTASRTPYGSDLSRRFW